MATFYSPRPQFDRSFFAEIGITNEAGELRGNQGDQGNSFMPHTSFVAFAAKPVETLYSLLAPTGT